MIIKDKEKKKGEKKGEKKKIYVTGSFATVVTH